MGAPSASLNIATWSCSGASRRRLQDLAQHTHVHVTVQLLIPSSFRLPGKLFDHLASDGREH